MAFDIRQNVKKLCSKERTGRIVIGLFVLLLAIILAFIQPFAGFIGIFLGIYLVVTGLLGSCLLYAIWRE